MDLLNIFASYIILSFASGIQSAPEYIKPTIEPESTVTIEIQEETPTPSPTPIPTPTFTPGPSPVPKPDITANPSYRLLKFKSKGDSVKELQTQLKKYGYYDGEIDGNYGHKTAQAVRIFQKLHSLTSDGVAGKETLTILFESDKILQLPSKNEDIIPITLETPAPTIIVPTFVPKK
ncbi:MAG: peptidoglycan-binding domain-containing protein [Eubacteriales bacterium]|nr:peptidoglycan-binding domain-containing protein [Eubacteriales bacterium]